jgi:hypothetical protein
LKPAYVMLARALAYIDIDELAPKGNVVFVNVVKSLAERYQFQKLPSSVEEFDRAKGVEFSGGVAGEIPIQRVAIFDSLILVETRTNTTDAQHILGEILAWAVEAFGLTFEDTMIKHWGYVSDVVFYSDPKLLETHPAVSRLANRVSSLVSETWDEGIDYQPIRLGIGHDPEARKWPVAAFTIERKSAAGFPENKYFSEAPVPTHSHWALLEDFEKEILYG